jgi:DNA-binding MarR family transcriptional regulator
MIAGSVGLALIRASKRHKNVGESRLAPLGLYIGQEMILFNLWRQDGLSQSELVERLEVEPATISKALTRMERAGLVRRRHDAEDGRVTRVYVTVRGRALEPRVTAWWAELESQAVRGLSKEDQRTLRRLLLAIEQNLS